MTTQAELKYYAALLQKKYRASENKFLVEGIKLILEAVNSGYECEALFMTNAFYDSNAEFITRLKGFIPELLKSREIEKLSDTRSPQGCVAVFANKKKEAADYLNDKLIVALEDISDPGNLGTILRNCDWFGIKNVIASPECAELLNPKVIRSSAGSVFHLNVFEEENFYSLLRDMKKEGFCILCADLDGINIYEENKYDKAVLILANEADGPTRELRRLSDCSVTIPKRGSAESLNVASASAVLLSELTK